MKVLFGIAVLGLLAFGGVACGDGARVEDSNEAIVVPSVAGSAGPDAVAALCAQGFPVAVTQIHDPTLDRSSLAGETTPGGGERTTRDEPVGLTVITRSERKLNLAAPSGCEAAIVASEESGNAGGSYSPQ